jgi:hypothetical protein
MMNCSFALAIRIRSFIKKTTQCNMVIRDHVNSKIKAIFLILTACLLFFSCENAGKSVAGKKVEIFLLASYDWIQDKCQVDPAAIVLQEKPFIENTDILSYDSKVYEYTLTEKATQKLTTILPRTPFAITVDKQVIFLFVHMPPIMSSTCLESITMSVDTSQSKMLLQLGYPWLTVGTAIDDKRNHPKLLETLANQGKL